MQILLYIFTAFILFNAIIQGGFGLEYAESPKKAIIPAVSMVFSGLVSWFVINYIFDPLGFEVFGIFLVLPISVLCSVFIVKLSILLQGKSQAQDDSSVYSAFNGIAFFGALQTVIFAQTALQALLFLLGGSMGFLCIIVMLHGMNKRSDIEAVPKFFKGQPLLLISAGLVSLIFTELLPMIIHIFIK